MTARNGPLQLITYKCRCCTVQVFYGIVVQHFANLASSTPLSMEAIDVMTVHILELTAEVPYYAATVARARLTRAYKRLSTALATLDGTEGGGWPGKPFASPYC